MDDAEAGDVIDFVVALEIFDHFVAGSIDDIAANGNTDEFGVGDAVDFGEVVHFKPRQKGLDVWHDVAFAVTSIPVNGWRGAFDEGVFGGGSGGGLGAEGKAKRDREGGKSEGFEI